MSDIEQSWQNVSISQTSLRNKMRVKYIKYSHNRKQNNVSGHTDKINVKNFDTKTRQIM